jgi:hypothetical protein
MADEQNHRRNEPFDPGLSREEAEDWLNNVPLFESEGEDATTGNSGESQQR